MTRVKFDPTKFRADTTDLASGTPVTLRFTRKLPLKVSIRETDNGYTILINPTKIRTEADYAFVLRSMSNSFWGEHPQPPKKKVLAPTK